MMRVLPFGGGGGGERAAQAYDYFFFYLRRDESTKSAPAPGLGNAEGERPMQKGTVAFPFSLTFPNALMMQVFSHRLPDCRRATASWAGVTGYHVLGVGWGAKSSEFQPLSQTNPGTEPLAFPPS